MGIDIFLKRTSVESSNVRVVIWDVSGNAFSSCLLDKYLYEANVSYFADVIYFLRLYNI